MSDWICYTPGCEEKNAHNHPITLDELRRQIREVEIIFGKWKDPGCKQDLYIRRLAEWALENAKPALEWHAKREAFWNGGPSPCKDALAAFPKESE